MNAKELAELCADSINGATDSSFAPIVSLNLPENKRCPKSRFPFGPKGPKGTVVQWGFPEGYDTVLFDPYDLLAYLAATGQIKITDKDGNPIVELEKP